MIRIATVTVAVLAVLGLFSQRTVSAGLSNPGDISIIGFQSDNPDSVSFVVWQDVAIGDSIDFWDHGL
ncbi:hypothetical protein MFFC18_23040 [Mariniblastus fucicola]|uniref:Uncharacterized protein n=1 Tax=Mariniblastus fucicola TaxID=980251 RepID=A0A5B9P7Y3_9BACT|nr:hypothetical protein MFFC18_23040 [Mariniblastus fucicola]